ncbi:unnamed protein product [Dicrocoelium dendriticum]|nr:unnamed protein product [Dicrocoelium dendriticum]
MLIQCASRTTRDQVLSLYRRIWRFAREWRSPSGSDAQTRKEADYIRNEARTLFRKNADLKDEQTIQAHIREAESRMQLAQHYGTPYPRLTNFPPHTLAAQVHRKSTKQIPHDQSSSETNTTHVSKRTERNLREAIPAYLRSYVEKSNKKPH